MPEEVRAAKRINSEGERIIEKAQEEAERIVARAQEQAAFLIDERGLTDAADAESRRIIAQAEDDGDAVRRGADEYAAGVLGGPRGRGDAHAARHRAWAWRCWMTGRVVRGPRSSRSRLLAPDPASTTRARKPTAPSRR